MKIILTIVIVLAFALMTIRHIVQRRKKTLEEILKELGELSWKCPKDALLKLEEIQPHSDRHEVRRVARHYLTVWCADLMSGNLPSLRDAFVAKEKFKNEMLEIKKTCKVFGLNHSEISPFNEGEILIAYLQSHVEVLEKALEHYPEAGWLNSSPGNIFSALMDYADHAYTQHHLEKWRGWIRSAYLRQAHRLLRRLHSRKYWSPEDAGVAVDKILTLLENAKANPEEIATTATELNELRQNARYGT
ncbi:MAG: hypothetical protein NT034_01065 [Candidatus Magasanikbacteria bacterium]|nr:hypothetical protein [Candidatus Magasanikbacteria bacterium]